MQALLQAATGKTEIRHIQTVEEPLGAPRTSRATGAARLVTTSIMRGGTDAIDVQGPNRLKCHTSTNPTIPKDVCPTIKLGLPQPKVEEKNPEWDGRGGGLGPLLPQKRSAPSRSTRDPEKDWRCPLCNNVNFVGASTAINVERSSPSTATRRSTGPVRVVNELAGVAAAGDAVPRCRGRVDGVEAMTAVTPRRDAIVTPSSCVRAPGRGEGRPSSDAVDRSAVIRGRRRRDAIARARRRRGRQSSHAGRLEMMDMKKFDRFGNSVHRNSPVDNRPSTGSVLVVRM